MCNLWFAVMEGCGVKRSNALIIISTMKSSYFLVHGAFIFITLFDINAWLDGGRPNLSPGGNFRLTPSYHEPNIWDIKV